LLYLLLLLDNSQWVSNVIGGALPGWTTAKEAELLLYSSVADVQHWRDMMREKSKAPKTLNRRISSLSSFYKYLAGSAAGFRLSVNMPNPAHAHFIARESSDPLEGTCALTATGARQDVSI
jgi:hypothetical protein